MNRRHRRYLIVLTVIFALIVIVSGIAPWHRQDWLLENALVVVGVFLLFAIYRHLPFSRLSWTLVFMFLCLHELGSHYTYSEVPYNDWCRALTGRSWNDIFNWQRNHFDRAVHFLYGLFLAYPVREIFLSLARARGFWSYFLPLDVMMSTSALYEIIEWGAAMVFGGDLGVAYLGTQGDPWDAQKDMLLAALGAFSTLTITAIVNWRCQRDFAREWADSLTVKKQVSL
jgi:putative membrane protein